ncbi:hypothetical protein ACFV8Z_40550 [Streptomyces sp. NPDC059837]|uniref:hypothetical protein n=1 Tax=unclassified Streptomyces TaxID=2593676 RepID=UPI0022554A3F|nr:MULTISPECIES: hypothetical protein [unclassified Streptomyces]MCX4402918.1 hypothetical protein [Streptomyces sp. NBC_01764]MCX5182110.1 hypothetical protein [Streptomyces sp. NBC_00268]
MISTRRMVAAVGLAVGVTGLAAPMASAAAAEAPAAGKLNPMTQLDVLAASGLPAEHQADIPRVADQLAGLNRLNDLNQLHQVTDLVAPVTGLLPGLQA